MKLINKRNKKIIADNISKSESFISNLFGLIPYQSGSMFFVTRWGIHTFFMKHPIDVVVLDKDLKVKKIKKVRPWNMFFWNPKYNYVIELPECTIIYKDILLEDQLYFE